MDGREKFFGYEGFVPGMTLADLHAPDFIVIDAPPSRTAQAGERVSVPLLKSSYSDRYHGQKLTLGWELWHDNLGTRVTGDRGAVELDWNGYGVQEIAPIAFDLPKQDAVAVLAVTLRDAEGIVVTRNFIAFDVRGGSDAPVYDADGRFVAVPVTDFAEQTFAYQWNAIQGGKANGGQAGKFVYDVKLPDASSKRWCSMSSSTSKPARSGCLRATSKARGNARTASTSCMVRMQRWSTIPIRTT